MDIKVLGWRNYAIFWSRLEFSVKSGEHSTRKNEFGPKPVEIQNKPAKKYIRTPGQAETQKSTIFFLVVK
jgi:hypothetical protein